MHRIDTLVGHCTVSKQSRLILIIKRPKGRLWEYYYASFVFIWSQQFCTSLATCNRWMELLKSLGWEVVLFIQVLTEWWKSNHIQFRCITILYHNKAIYCAIQLINISVNYLRPSYFGITILIWWFFILKSTLWLVDRNFGDFIIALNLSLICLNFINYSILWTVHSQYTYYQYNSYVCKV